MELTVLGCLEGYEIHWFYRKSTLLHEKLPRHHVPRIPFKTKHTGNTYALWIYLNTVAPSCDFLPQDLTSRPVDSCPKLSIETVSRLIFWCCSFSIDVFFSICFLSGLHSQGWLIWKTKIYTGLDDLSMESLRMRDFSSFTVLAWTVSSEREFHILTTLVEKKWCL